HGDTGKYQAGVFARTVECERWLAWVGAIGAQRNLVAEPGDIGQQAVQLLRFGTVIEGRDDLKRLRDLFQIGFTLTVQIVVQYDRLPLLLNFCHDWASAVAM